MTSHDEDLPRDQHRLDCQVWVSDAECDCSDDTEPRSPRDLAEQCEDILRRHRHWRAS